MKKLYRSHVLLFVIFVQSLIATLGSLYYGWYGDPIHNIFSLGVLFPLDSGFFPCELCWFARILMYPLVLLSGYALFKKDYRIVDYIIVFAFIGIFLELYHYYLQKFQVATSFVCTAANPCAAMDVDYFGFITIPFLCLLAFMVIFFACILIKKLR